MLAVKPPLDHSRRFSDRNCRGSLGSENISPRSEPALTSIIKSFFKDESGVTAIEYGLIAAGIAIAIITAVNGLGTQLSTNFVTISNSLK
jgi:pilus assembly protein Flp/PilA